MGWGVLPRSGTDRQTSLARRLPVQRARRPPL